MVVPSESMVENFMFFFFISHFRVVPSGLVARQLVDWGMVHAKKLVLVVIGNIQSKGG
jgi:hypothetical protein